MKNKNEMTAAEASAPEVKPGDTVDFVLADKSHIEARVTAVRDYGQIDLEVDRGRKLGKLVVTSSPHDPTGTKPDHWFIRGTIKTIPLENGRTMADVSGKR